MRAKRGLYKSVVLPTALCAAETGVMTAADKKHLYIVNIRCLRSMCGVTRWDRLRKKLDEGQ